MQKGQTQKIQQLHNSMHLNCQGASARQQSALFATRKSIEPLLRKKLNVEEDQQQQLQNKNFFDPLSSPGTEINRVSLYCLVVNNTKRYKQELQNYLDKCDALDQKVAELEAKQANIEDQQQKLLSGCQK